MVNETKIREYLEKNNLDAFFIAKKVNVRFVSGYTGDDSYLLITKDKLYFITDPRYTEQAAIEAPDYEIVNWRLPGLTVADTVRDLSAKEKIKSIAFEDDHLTYDMYADMAKKVKADLVQAGGIIDDMRMIKTPQEISYLRNACDISCRAFRRILKDIRVGVTEKELAAKLASYMVEEGSDTQPYGNIIISGARSSLLHGIPSSKAVEYGDFVLMDFGCQYNGYLSDMTRTVVVGKADAKQREVYELEKQMLERSEEVMKAGTGVHEVFEASIEPIKDTEYYQYIYNNIGHGVGMFIHEMPYISTAYKNYTLEPGMVLTIEPGIYIPNWGGVRIEDQILITEDGYENFIDIPHDLIEL